eukprot:CAMPEP_0115875826 /NCGR_PEP_ID=MMETSP0287-20121206/25317_1 /TAXON_ID=412157 /ORGANISM="Chrysochromulina rotalis, Strain UIO044" /LENGTH=186 /DNA_ID=CAMNT_0003331141 /DNA_START=352 /DNA_END=914 /DNA_ORIENTATION=-
MPFLFLQGVPPQAAAQGRNHRSPAQSLERPCLRAAYRAVFGKPAWSSCARHAQGGEYPATRSLAPQEMQVLERAKGRATRYEDVSVDATVAALPRARLVRRSERILGVKVDAGHLKEAMGVDLPPSDTMRPCALSAWYPVPSRHAVRCKLQPFLAFDGKSVIMMAQPGVKPPSGGCTLLCWPMITV